MKWASAVRGPPVERVRALVRNARWMKGVAFGEGGTLYDVALFDVGSSLVLEERNSPVK